MKRVALILAAIALMMPAGVSAQNLQAIRDRTAHPPIHVRGSATASPTGSSPKTIRDFYGFSSLASTTNGAGEVIAIIDAYDDPTIAGDLGVFNTTFRLPAMQTRNCQVGAAGAHTPCFQKVFAQRKPKADGGWALEISLDVEWAHAIAPQADILLVEAQSNSLADLLGAVTVASNNSAVHVVSMSWGTNEFLFQVLYDSYFNVANVIFVAASGDYGNPTWPAASPYVVGVGGTMFANARCAARECTWNDAYLGLPYSSGGGQSAVESEPSYQTGVQSTGWRGIPDVAYYADISPGYSVYDTTSYNGQKGWFAVGGTSAGSPQWAALFALADQLRHCGTSGTCLPEGYWSPYSLYGVAGYNSITTGCNSTGQCANPSGGYSFVTGLGSPQAPTLLPALSSAP
ncbi:MAG TPA: S53 family peptidase [bacterium]|nr:S53 family peptidase [bacterium]